MKIVVITPVYNGESFIDRCIKSVLNQSYPNWEMIVVDDGSTDKTYEHLTKYRDDKRIRIIKKENEGAGKARNTALELIKDPDCYIVFLDADDYISSNYFELLSNHNEDLVFIDVEQTDIIGKGIKEERISVYSNEDKDFILRKQMTGYIPWGGVRKAVKANIIIDNHIRFSEMKIGEEAIYSFKSLYFASSVGFIDQCVYSYYQRPDSASSSFNENPWGKVYGALKNEITSMNVYDKFADTLNAFAISSCAVALRRISVYKYSEYKKKAKELRAKLKQDIDKTHGIDKASLNSKAKLVNALVNLRCYLFIFLLGRISYKPTR